MINHGKQLLKEYKKAKLEKGDKVNGVKRSAKGIQSALNKMKK